MERGQHEQRERGGRDLAKGLLFQEQNRNESKKERASSGREVPSLVLSGRLGEQHWHFAVRSFIAVAVPSGVGEWLTLFSREKFGVYSLCVPSVGREEPVSTELCSVFFSAQPTALALPGRNTRAS